MQAVHSATQVTAIDYGNMRKSDEEEACKDLESYLVSLLRQIHPSDPLPSGVVEEVKAQLAEMKDPRDSSLLQSLNTSPVLQHYPAISCSKCRKSLQLRDIAFITEASANQQRMIFPFCSLCYGQGELCAFCGEQAQKGEVHRACLSAYFRQSGSVPIVVKDRELTHREVLERLDGDLVETYKEMVGLIAYFHCPNSPETRGKVDFSQRNWQCTCGLDLYQLPHIPLQGGSLLPPSNLLAYQANYEAVQDYLSTTSHRVVQCPHCHGPNLSSPTAQQCYICAGEFYSCCSCKAVPVTTHGGAMHRVGCREYTVEYREERCGLCEEEERCKTPGTLKVAGRFALDEIYHLE